MTRPAENKGTIQPNFFGSGILYPTHDLNDRNFLLRRQIYNLKKTNAFKFHSHFRPYFYSVAIEGELGGFLNVIRLLCNPYTTRVAHITLRGPYFNRSFLSFVKRFRRLDNPRITVDGIGTFSNPSSKAVFFKARFDGIKSIWNKWTYSSDASTAHITLYDGSDLTFAAYLERELSRYDWKFQLFGGPLLSFPSKPKEQLDFSVYISIPKLVLEECFGEVITLNYFYTMNEADRMDSLKNVLCALREHAMKSPK